MSAYTLSSTWYKSGSIPGGDGLVFACGTCTGSASYDTAGSILDLSTVFASKVYWLSATANNADYAYKWVPGAANASDVNKLFADDDAGTEASSTDDHSTTPGTIEWFAIGTDG